MPLNSGAIATGIAALSVSGVTIKSLSNVPDIITVGECPIMIPDVDNWITGGLGEGEASDTFGPGMWTFDRAFGYLYFHAATGQKVGLSAYLSAISTNLDAIMTALTTLNVTGVDVMQVECSGLGSYTDQAGNSFYGCRISVTLKEKVNA